MTSGPDRFGANWISRKALIEIPPRFAGRQPVHPDGLRGVGATGVWQGPGGLAEDLRRYGAWMRDEAEERIGHLYPKVRLPREQGGGEATVVAWIWCRTVRCPNPACGAQTPLAGKFALSTKAGKETWNEPIVDRETRRVQFTVQTGRGKAPEGTVNRQGARCIVCGSSIPFDRVRSEGRAGGIGAQLMAIVAQGQRGRTYLPPDDEHDRIARSAEPPADTPDSDLPEQALGFRVQAYGMTKHRDLFTPRQLVALTMFSDLVSEARERVRRDAVAAGLNDDGVPLAESGSGATAYADAVATYLAFAVDKVADRGSSLTRWMPSRDSMYNTFARQALPMMWDYVEVNPLGEQTGGFAESLRWTVEALDGVSTTGTALVALGDAASLDTSTMALVSTDPPYYDNIGYADLSDFFYVWLRRSLRSAYPSLFGTLLTPKARELVATPFRFDGSRAKAEQHFEHGLGVAFSRIRAAAHPDYPVTVYYAFKQAESEDSVDGGKSIASTGWETMLEGLLASGFSVDGTWPMRSELGNRMNSLGSNTLASSIVLVCRPRPESAGITTRRDFVGSLRSELPGAIRLLQQSNIAPVDLAQASIGPGMAVFSRYAKVLEPDGSSMTVRTALALINQALDELLAEQEGEFDADTRWAIAWYEQFGLKDAEYGTAETLSKAKNSSVAGLAEAGIVEASRGRVRLLDRSEYSSDWDPTKDRRLPVWEATQRLVQVLLTDGEAASADLLARLGGLGDTARDLAYRLYQLAERKGWTDEARAYNALVVAWTDLSRGADSARVTQPAQGNLGLE
jgi:putative DNA methylase